MNNNTSSVRKPLEVFKGSLIGHWDSFANSDPDPENVSEKRFQNVQKPESGFSLLPSYSGYPHSRNKSHGGYVLRRAKLLRG